MSSNPATKLQEKLAQIDKNDAPRWMLMKDGLDHGPFSGRDLVQMIMEGQAGSDHGLTNIDTREYEILGESTLFADFVHQYQINVQHHTQKTALERSKRIERAGNLFKVVVGLGVIGALGLGVAGYVMTRQEAEQGQSDTDLAALYERGEIQIEGQAGILDAPRGRRARSARSKAQGGGDFSYEDAMNQAVNLGDVSGGADITTLSSAQVASIMNRHMRSLNSCVGAELRSGNRPGKVRIDLAIQGSGQVLGATVHAGSEQFKSCVVSQVRKVQFPSFSSPRMGASFTFRVD